jgi:uncharacterized membrane protein
MQVLFSVLLMLQCVVIVAHDMVDIPGWVPGRQVREVVGQTKFLVGTAVNAIFPVLAVVFAIYFRSRPKPAFVYSYWAWYCGITVASAIAMWWIPYFFGAKEETRRMYTEMYRGTRQLLPARGDNPRPNVFHLMLHVLLASTLVLALLLRFGHR